MKNWLNSPKILVVLNEKNLIDGANTAQLQGGAVSGLNSLRFLAFLLVYCSHLFPKFEFGHTGVQLFFVISSFLLTYLALRELETTGKFSKVNFYIRRSLRIYPLYFLVLIFAFALLPWLIKSFHVPVTLPTEKWKYWLFLSNFEYSPHVFFLKLLWSISVEEQFYLAFIFFSFAFSRFHYLLCFLLTLVYLIYFSQIIKGNILNVYFNPLSYLPCFVSGMLIAKIFVEKKEALKRVVFVYLLLIIILYAFVKFWNADDIASYPLIACSYSVLLLIVLMIQAKLKDHRSTIFRLLESCGRYSYGLYVYSGLAITLNLTVMHIKQPILAALAISSILFPIAAISFHFFESPFLNLKARFRAQKPQGG